MAFTLDLQTFLPSKQALLLSALTALTTWGLHSFVSLHDANATLEQHTADIKELKTGQVSTHDALGRIESKVDVLGQKLDDSITPAVVARAHR